MRSNPIEDPTNDAEDWHDVSARFGHDCPLTHGSVDLGRGDLPCRSEVRGRVVSEDA
jgi:hypothetical protein